MAIKKIDNDNTIVCIINSLAQNIRIKDIEFHSKFLLLLINYFETSIEYYHQWRNEYNLYGFEEEYPALLVKKAMQDYLT